MYISSIRTPKRLKQIPIDLKGEVDNNTIMIKTSLFYLTIVDGIPAGRKSIKKQLTIV